MKKAAWSPGTQAGFWLLLLLLKYSAPNVGLALVTTLRSRVSRLYRLSQPGAPASRPQCCPLSQLLYFCTQQTASLHSSRSVIQNVKMGVYSRVNISETFFLALLRTSNEKLAFLFFICKCTAAKNPVPTSTVARERLALRSGGSSRPLTASAPPMQMATHRDAKNAVVSGKQSWPRRALERFSRAPNKGSVKNGLMAAALHTCSL